MQMNGAVTLARFRRMNRSRWTSFAAMLFAAVGIAPALDAEAASPTLAKIRDTGVVTLGYRADSAPFAYLDERRRSGWLTTSDSAHGSSRLLQSRPRPPTLLTRPRLAIS